MRDSANGSRKIYKILKQNRISNTTSILALTKNDIKELEYNGEEESFQLNLGQCNRIAVFIAFSINQIRAGQPLKEHEWLNVTHEQYGKFRIIYNPYDYI